MGLQKHMTLKRTKLLKQSNTYAWKPSKVFKRIRTRLQVLQLTLLELLYYNNSTKVSWQVGDRVHVQKDRLRTCRVRCIRQSSMKNSSSLCVCPGLSITRTRLVLARSLSVQERLQIHRIVSPTQPSISRYNCSNSCSKYTSTLVHTQTSAHVQHIPASQPTVNITIRRGWFVCSVLCK